MIGLVAAATLGTLATQALAEGECAIFLWRAAERPVLTAVLRPGVARIALADGAVDLARADGGITLDPVARYAAAGGASLVAELSLEERPGLEQGAVVSGGSIGLIAADGEEIVVPVGGMLACR